MRNITILLYPFAINVSKNAIFLFCFCLTKAEGYKEEKCWFSLVRIHNHTGTGITRSLWEVSLTSVRAVKGLSFRFLAHIALSISFFRSVVFFPPAIIHAS